MRLRTLLQGLLILLSAGVAQAGALTELTMTPSANVIGLSTTYQLKFRAPGALGTNRVLRITNASGAGGNTNFDNAVLQSAVGGTLSWDIGLAVPGELFLNINGGTATGNTLVTLTFTGIVNPLVASGNGYNVAIEDANTFSVIDSGVAPGHTYVPNPAPVVTQALPDHSSREAQSGQFIAVANLDTHFADGDGDPLVFSVTGNTNAAVATAQIVGTSLRITPLAFGTTSITVQASDNAEGTISDTFTVGAIGFLTPSSVTPADLVVGRTTSYTIAFTTRTALGPGDFVILQHPAGGPNQAASTLQSISNGLAATKTAGGALFTVLQINSGSVATNTPISIVLAGLVNPAAVSTGPQYLIEKTNGADTQDRARLNGSSYVAAPNTIFLDGFE